MTYKLAELLGGNGVKGDTIVSGLTVDSRAVKPGNMFVALPGSHTDGRKFIEDAIRSGATSILSTPDAVVPDHVAFVEDKNPRKRYAELAARFCGTQPEVQVAITGTNGKTSVADFVRQLWQLNGVEAASIGTLGVKSGQLQIDGGLTTPDPVDLYGAMAQLAEKGVQHVAVEASSHGLDQNRLDGLNLSAAGFTNLTRDHLDYHQTEFGYFYAKARMFAELLMPGDGAVINVDDHWGATLDDVAWARNLSRITVGKREGASIHLVEQRVVADGQVIEFTIDGGRYEVKLPLIGGFQAHNVLMALGLVHACGGKVSASVDAMERLNGVPGRMELIGLTSKGGAVFVDYAHTPDGLRTVLKAARAHRPNKLHVVFGCGGDRDAGKRPQMGEIASKLADTVYVTDDNPRSEEASVIREQIMIAAQGAMEVGDRAEAIAKAIENMGSGDMLIVAGKGHETGQIVGNEILPFSDVDAVKAVLGEGA
ncbi:UDP-N-acetylmuramoyl-L-alanyl-D-glutamate--2,6-diaminopimelate ligase [Kordiimonas laminariae]|uniref:UDP-N-acetylmuramoyl-L-alanyl-D-glutamate--2, 6-diaminopimelate ligase n=1 Tax=Kordiimonas laminariae TaxID=2917717 RepID=UPI001FF3429A|nr:UDP-N-acetylmuramoyl-L-alanyl-D-glutamate--2,6-diaminopimelate ligase [Kordiimonas laminariae]MCK0068666.1 UDP-N-acetylmuramoyl-L-alanyl-D-glutamate--2,6-diaminopimelate ligase [Kordiimonas laminariae]